MTPWTRRKPADFDEILAELERAQAPKWSEPVDAAPTEDGQSHAAPAGIVADRAAAHFPRRLSRVLSGLPWQWLWGGKTTGMRSAAAYAEEEAEPQATEAPPAGPQSRAPRPPISEDEAIAEELGLTRPLTRADLERLRRDFAKTNHPDCCSPTQRPRAARRMSIANMLIDAELKQKQRPR